MPRTLAFNAGPARESFTVQTKSIAVGEGRTKVITWVDAFEIYGKLSVLWSIERWRTFRLEETINHEVETRYDAGLTVGCRLLLVDGEINRYFSVEAIIDVDLRHRRMILGCVEKADKNT